MQKQLKVGTHDGPFHCDEVLACVMLTKYTNQFAGAEILRSRDDKKLEECDIIVDVGGKHEPPKYFDHHQRQFTGTHPNFKIKLSSAGLVYLQFEEIIPNIIKTILSQTQLPFKPVVNTDIEKQIRNKIYEGFILAIDANDNGVEICEGERNYSINSAIWNRIGRVNPMWWDEQADETERFNRAMKIADQQLIEQVSQTLLGSVQTKEIVKEAFDARKQVHESGQIVQLPKFVPWQSSLFAIEKQTETVGTVKYVLFPEKGNKGWRVQAVPSGEGSFTLRKGLKEELRGIKQPDELIKVSGIADIVFVHNSGFIGGAKSLESALKLAVMSL